MEIYKYQDVYEKLLEKLGNVKVQVSRSKAYYLCENNNLMHTYPFPEDVNMFGELHDRKYTEAEIAELVKKSDAELEVAQKGTNDNIGDFNIFNLKYYNKRTRCFDIPMADIAKNYFLCYQHNINDFRKGLKSLDTISAMQIYEHILQSARKSVVELLSREIGLNLEFMGGFDALDKDYENYLDLDRAREHAEEAKKIINALKENENKSSDYKNTRKGAGYTIFGADFEYFNFSKQMFIDLIEVKFKDNPIVKKAVSVYVESQSDKLLMTQIENIYQNYASEEARDRRYYNHEWLQLDGGRYSLEGSIYAELLK